MSAQNTDFKGASMQPQDSVNTFDASEAYKTNHQTLLRVLNVSDSVTEIPRKLSLAIERILVDRAHNTLVPYAGDRGIETLLRAFSDAWQVFHERWYNGHLMGIYGALGASTGEAIRFEVSLAPGGQLICTAGPTTSLSAMLEAFDAFDRQLHVVSYRMGCDYVLLSEGYNPLVKSPLDVALVPRTRWTLYNAHLGQTGRYARDAMRCECATTITMGLGTSLSSAQEYRTAVALMPILTFLTDNVRSFRGADPRNTQRMTRSIIWDEVDKTRCGVVPTTFDEDFGAESYISWLEDIQPIIFVDDAGTTTSTGKQTLRDIMHQRTFTTREAANALTNVLPSVRLLSSSMELMQADALRPRMAVAYLAFVKGLFSSRFAVSATSAFLGRVSVRDVENAMRSLRAHGWNAHVYGKSISQIVDQLLQIARTELDTQERRVLAEIAEQWEVHMVPRDTFVHQAFRHYRD